MELSDEQFEQLKKLRAAYGKMVQAQKNDPETFKSWLSRNPLNQIKLRLLNACFKKMGNLEEWRAKHTTLPRVMDEDGEEIPKPSFGREMKKWITSLKDAYEATSASKGANTPILVKQFKEELRKKFSKDIFFEQLLWNNLSKGISDEPLVQTRKALADRLAQHLGTINNDDYWETIYKKKESKPIRKKYRKDDTMEGHLPSYKSVAAVLNFSTIEAKNNPDHPTQKDDEVIDTWLEAERANLEKLSFDEGAEVDCDSFAMDVEQHLNKEIQTLLTQNIGSGRKSKESVRKQLIANLNDLSVGDEPTPILLKNIETIKELSNSNLANVLSADESEFKTIEKALEEAYNDISELATKINKKGGADVYTDMQQVRLESSRFVSEVLLNNAKEDAIKGLDLVKKLEQALGTCQKNPNQYAEYLDKDSLGINAMISSVITHSHNVSEGELAKVYTDKIGGIIPSKALTGKYDKQKLQELLKSCFSENVAGYELMEGLYTALWIPEIDGLTPIEGDTEYVAAEDLSQALQTIEDKGFSVVKAALENLYSQNNIRAAGMNMLLKVAQDFEGALPQQKDIVQALNTAKFYPKRPKLGGGESLACTLFHKSEDGTATVPFTLGVQPIFAGKFPVLKLNDVAKKNISFDMWGTLELTNVSLGQEKIDTHHYKRDIIFDFVWKGKTAHSNTAASQNSSSGGSIGGNLGTPKLFGCEIISGSVSANYNWSNITVGPKYTKGDFKHGQSAIQLTLTYHAKINKDSAFSGKDHLDPNYMVYIYPKGGNKTSSEYKVEIDKKIPHQLSFKELQAIFQGK